MRVRSLGAVNAGASAGVISIRLAVAAPSDGVVRGEAPHRDAELLGLVGEVGGDAGAGEHDDADRQRVGLERLVGILLEVLGFFRPARLRRDTSGKARQPSRSMRRPRRRRRRRPPS
jgi:hypothetical protein